MPPLLVLGLVALCSSTSSYPKHSTYTSSFDLTDAYFHQIRPFDNYLFVGGRDVILRLALDNVGNRKSQEFKQRFLRPTAQLLESCLKFKGRQRLDCSNHVRLLLPKDNGSLLVCATNAFKPTVYQLNLDLGDIVPASFQTGYCSPNRSHKTTAIWSVDKNPNGKAMAYIGSVIDAANTEGTIYRPPLDNDHSAFMFLPRLQTNWLYSPQFAASFDIGDMVLFFANELSLALSSDGRPANVPTVIRVCKNDVGGDQTMANEWTTFRKARLYCGYNNVSDSVTFNRLDGVVRVSFDRFDGIFSVRLADDVVSIICSFRLKDIVNTLESGHKCPTRPIQVNLTEEQAERLKGSVLASSPVKPVNSIINQDFKSPVIFRLNELVIASISVPQRLNKMWSASMGRGSVPSSVLYLATDRGNVYKVAQPSDDDEYYTISAWAAMENPFILSMELFVSQKGKGSIYLGCRNSVLQIPMITCEIYETCHLCELDPWCSWTVESSNSGDVVVGRCEMASVRRLVKQQKCADFQKPTVLEERTVKFDHRTSPVLKLTCGTKYYNGKISWRNDSGMLSDHSLITADNELVIFIHGVDQPRSLSGRYICYLDSGPFKSWNVIDATVDDPGAPAKHDSAYAVGNVGNCITDQDYIRQYEQWCRELENYQQAYNAWEQMKQRVETCQSLPIKGDAGIRQEIGPTI